MATSQGLPAATRGWKRPARDSPPEPLGVMWPCRFPDFSGTDFRLQALRTWENECLLHEAAQRMAVSAATGSGYSTCVLCSAWTDTICCLSEIQI